MYKLSGSEKKSYIQDTYYEYKEAAYGEPIRVTRADIEYYVTTDGVISSSEYITIDIKDIESDNILVQPGNEIYKDKEITTGQKIIKAPCNGIVESVDTGNRIRVLSFDKLQLVTNIPIDKLNYIKESKSLSFNENEKLTVREISNIAQGNKVKLYLILTVNHICMARNYLILRYIPTRYILKYLLLIKTVYIKGQLLLCKSS